MTRVVILSKLREMRTVYQDGGWHWRNDARRDNIGDFATFLALVGDRLFWVLMARMGTPPPGGAFWWKPYGDGDPATGWRQGSTGWGEIHQPPIKALPLPLGTVNIDSHCGAQMPGSWRFHWVHSVKNRNGLNHLERATSERIDSDPAAYTRFAEEVVPEFSGEPSLVFNPWALRADVFYVKKSQEPPDPYGVRYRSRVYRRTAPLETFDAGPRFSDEQLVFSPDQNGQGPWGTAFTVLQPGICALPDRRYLMTALGKVPIVLRNGEPAVGQMNKTTAAGCWVSNTAGTSWEPVVDNPVFSREFLELESGNANQINSVHPFVDPMTGRVYVAMQINRTGHVNKLGSRLMLCEVAVI